MTDLLIIGGVIAAALLVIASGVWVAIELVAELSQPGPSAKDREPIRARTGIP